MLKLIVGLINRFFRLFATLNNYTFGEKGEIAKSAVPHSFMRLEPRRVLSVNASFVAGTLDVVFVNDGVGSTTASLHDLAGGQFYLDANGNHSFDALSEISGAQSDLHHLVVKGDAGIGDFFWNDDFSAAPLDQGPSNSVDLSNLHSANLSTIANVGGNVSINATHTSIGGNIGIDGTLTVSNSALSSSISIDPNAQINVTGQTNLMAGIFDHGAGSVLIAKAADIEVHDHATIEGAIETTVGSIRIHSDGAAGISMSSSASLHAFDSVELIAETNTAASIGANEIHAGNDILLYASSNVTSHGPIESTDGNITLQAGHTVLVSDEVSTSHTGTVYLTGDIIRIDGTIGADADIFLSAKHGLDVQGDVHSSAGQVGFESSSTINFLSSSHIDGAGVLIESAGIFTADGQVDSSGDIAISIDTDAIINGSLVATANLGMDAGRSIRVGHLQAENISLNAGSNIVTANAGVAGINIDANQLQLVAAGRIGSSDIGNGNSDQNANAISLDVSTLAAKASTGIYIHSVGDLAVGSITAFSSQAAIDVKFLQHDGSPDQLVNSNLKIDSDPAVQDGLLASNGPIAIKVDAGNLVVQAGSVPHSTVISANGDILLWASESISLNGDIESTLGQIEIRATDKISSSASISANRGTLYIHSDEIALNGDASAKFDLQLEAIDSLSINSKISSNLGQAGLIGDRVTLDTAAVLSGIGVFVSARGDLTLTGSINSQINAVLDSGNDIVMSGELFGKFIALQSSNDILLGEIHGFQVIVSAGQNILDNNSAALNIQAAFLQMSAGGAIGSSSLASSPDTNPAAIDLSVTRIAAHAVSEIYLQEVNSASGDLQVGAIGSFSASVTTQVNEVNFNGSSASPVAPITKSQTTDPSIQELVSSAGAIGIKVDAGSLIVKDAGVSALGDILLLSTDSIVLNGAVTTTAGSIELGAGNRIFGGDSISADHGTVYVHSNTIQIFADVVADSDLLVDAIDALDIRANISSIQGQVALRGNQVGISHSLLISSAGIYIDAIGNLTLAGTLNSGADIVLTAGNNISMSGQATATDVVALRSGNDLLLGEIHAQAVTLTAGRNILDNNGPSVNVQAVRLEMSAGGSIGTSSLALPVDFNPAAIDLIVGTVAARAASGIYLQQLASANGDLRIGEVSAISGSVDVQTFRVNFNGSPPTAIASNVTISASAMEDLITIAGEVKVKVDGGSLIVQDGGDANSIGVSAGSDVLLWASHSIQLSGDVISSVAQIELRATDDITANSSIVASSGSVYVHANTITLSGSVGSRTGTLIDGRELLTINSEVGSTNGQVGLRANDVLINDTSSIKGVGVFADATNNLTLSGSISSSADIVLVADHDINMNGQANAVNTVAAEASNDILLGQVQGRLVALTSGRDILDNNGATANVQADRLQMSAGGSIGTSSLSSPVDSNPEAIDLIVGTVAARAVNGIYLQELASASGDLQVGNVGIISGNVRVQVHQVNVNGSSSTPIAPVVGSSSSNPAAQEDLIATAGAVKVRVDAGSLFVFDGPDVNSLGISASGDVLLWASNSIANTGDVVSTGGNVELRAADSVTSNASIASDGTLYIHSNDITLSGGIVAGSDILAEAVSSLKLNGTVSSTSGQVGLRANDVTINASGSVVGAGIYSEAANLVTLTGTLKSSADAVIIAGSDIDMNGQVTATNVVGLQAGRDILLGQVEAKAVTMTTGRNVLDNNAATVNVQADRLQVSAGGSIGTSSLGSPVDINPSAIDLMVGTLAARAANGIYLEEVNSVSGNLTIGNVGSIGGSVVVQVNRVNFNSSPSTSIGQVIGSITSDSAAQQGLVADAGSVNVKVDAGSLIVDSGSNGSPAVLARGDVLLWASQSTTLNGNVESIVGQIGLRATDNITANASITSGLGTIYLHSNDITLNQAVSANSDVLADAGRSLAINSNISSTDGQVGLRGNSVTINSSGVINGVGIYAKANVDLAISGQLNSTADLVLIASNDLVMSGRATASNVVAIQAGNDLLLGELHAQAVTLTAGRSILDNNGTVVNVQASRLQMSAGGSIGASSLASPVDTNPAAIDLMVGTVAARAANGIYLEQLASASGDLQIGDVGPITGRVIVQVNRVNFNGTAATPIGPVTGNVRSDAGSQEDLVASSGAVKVRVDGGSLVVNDGPDANTIGVSASGDVLLWASQSITTNADAVSSAGVIELRAAETITTNGSVKASVGTVYIHSGNIALHSSVSASADVFVDASSSLTIDSILRSTNGQVGLRADNLTINTAGTISGVGIYLDVTTNLVLPGSINSTADIVLTAGNNIAMSGSIAASNVVAAQAGNDILLGQVQAQAVTLTAGRNILDNNGSVANVQADRLQMLAGGSIGTSSLGSPVDTNPAAIDLIVGTLAARAATGIYVEELTSAGGDLRIGDVGTISGNVGVQVGRVNFNSSPSTLIAPVNGIVTSNSESQEDLVATSGAVKVKVDSGNLLVTDGPDANSIGVSASGDVLLWASQSITVNGVVQSAAGQIELRAVADISTNTAITANIGTLYIHSSNASLNAAATAGSDILIDAAGLLTINASLSSSQGQIGLLADDLNINAAAVVNGIGIYANANSDLTLSGRLTSSADVVLTAGGDIVMSGQATAANVVAMQAGQDILLGQVQGQAATLTAGRNILDNNAAAVNVQADLLQMLSGGSIGTSSLASPVDTNPAAIDLIVGTVAARSTNGIYLQELSSSGGDLRIGNVGTIVGDVGVQVNRVNFNSSPSTPIAPVTGRITSNSTAQEDLSATAGAIKIKVDNGSLIVDDGLDANTLGVSANGDLLLWASQSITLNGDIQSILGQIELKADATITANSSIVAKAGTLYMHASNIQLNESISADLDILADASNLLAVNAALSSANGQVGLRAADVVINASGIISGIGIYADATNDLTLAGSINSSADVVLVAGVDVLMSGQATASNVIAAQAGNDILLGQVQAQAVTLTAGRNILDNNAIVVNVQADRLQMSAGGSIGTSSLASPVDTNPAAIDLIVGTVAARAANGIYLEELSSVSGDLQIGNVGIISASVVVQVNHVNFNSSPATAIAPVTVSVTSDRAIQEDLVATAGAVKVKVDGGSLIVTDGPDANTIGVSASGDLLLWASQSIATSGDVLSTAGVIELRAATTIVVDSSINANAGTAYLHAGDITLDRSLGASSDILVDASNSLTINTTVHSTGGQVGLLASDLTINAIGSVSGIGIYSDATNNLTLSGLINSTADIVLVAGNDIEMIGQATASNIAAAQAGRDILLGQVQARAVTLTAGRNILDNNGSVINVQADLLQMLAGDSIGASSLGSPVDMNPAAIDLIVGTVAARAANGIYLEELASPNGDLQIGNVGSISGNVSVQVARVNFNSSPSTAIAPVNGLVTSNATAQEDLVSTAGDVKVKVDAGSLTVNDGPDTNSIGVSASGDLLLWASQSVTVNGAIQSTAGHIELRAASDIVTNTAITADVGTLYIHSANIVLNSAATAGSDVLLDASGSINVSGSVTSNSGQVGLRSVEISINDAGLIRGVGVFVDATNTLTLAGAINSTADIVLTAGTDILMSGRANAINVVAMQAGRDILLGQAAGQAVTLTAGRNILDNNAAAVNVQADRLQMFAGGSIGTPSPASPVDTNPAAIDLIVDTVAAQSAGGIYLEEVSSASGDLRIGNVGVITGSVVVQVNQVNFNGSASTLIAPITRAVTSNSSVQEDLVTTTGAIKVKVDAGILFVVDGPDADRFSVSTTSGDILLWGASGLAIEAQVASNSGDITLRSNADIDVDAAVSTSGSIYMIGGNINVNATVSGSEGVLIRSTQDIVINQTIASVSGSVGLVASGHILQNANISASDNLFVQSGEDFVMAITTSSSANSNVVIVAGGDVRLSLITADRIGIDTGGNVLDVNANNQANLRSREAIIRAVGSIGESFENNGSPDQNARAIDVDVQSISSTSRLGTYLNHVTPNGTLLVAPVQSIGTFLNIHQAQFNSSNTAVSLAGLPLILSGQQDSIAGGVYKLVSAGNILVQDGTDANTLEIIASGDVLLKASGNVTLSGGVQSSAGNIALQTPVLVDVRAEVLAAQNVFIQSNDITIRQLVSSDDNVLLQASDSIELSGQIVSTGGSIGVVAGSDVSQSGSLNANRDLLIAAEAGTYQMSGAATARAGNNAIVIAANGIVFTKVIVDRDAAVSTESGNIVGIEQSVANITATNLSLRAVNGRIGSADSAGDSFDALGYGSINLGALDLNVSSTLAVSAQSGIYLNEASAVSHNLHVGTVGAVSVTVPSTDVNFNSTRDSVASSRSIDALAYINTQTSQAGSNRAIDLRNQNGSIIVDESANTSLDGVFSRDGSIYLATNVTTANADGFILLGESVRSLGTGVRGDIGLRSFDWISDSNSSVLLSGTNLHIQSQAFTHLAKTVVDTLNADVGRPGNLQDFQKVNLAASNRGDDFLSLINMPGESDDQFFSGDPISTNRVDPENFRFADRLAGSYSLYLVNTKSLTVDSVIGAGNAPHVYIETLGASDLSVHGTIATFSNTATEGAIVLVAGRNLMLDLTPGSAAQLMTQSALPDGQTRMQIVNQFGSGDFILNVKAFAGGDGIDPRSTNTSTEFVVDDRGELTRLALMLADPSLRNRTDAFQRVVMQFGSEGESGFNVYLRYADGFGQEFNTLGDVGVRSVLNANNNLPVNDNSIGAQLAVDNKAAVFSRIIAFESQFLFANENLPTLGVIRRADDFFLFENAADSGGVVDMTYETFNVDNVKARGTEIGFTQLLQDIPPIVPPPIIPPPELEPIQTNLPPTIRLDLPVAVEKQFEVAVYRVHFDDLNHNGYADDNELPSSEQVLNAQDIELQANQQSSEPTEGFRIRIESFTTGSGAPTSQQIEELKAKLMNDPEMPTGAYSIVETDASDSESVLDIFSVREETPRDYQDEERIPLVRPKNGSSDESQLPPPVNETDAPSDNENSMNTHVIEPYVSPRFATLASAGTLAAAFLYSRQSTQESSSLMDELGNDSDSSRKLNRSARRTRRIAGLMSAALSGEGRE